jgi:hypothetical protein
MTFQKEELFTDINSIDMINQYLTKFFIVLLNLILFIACSKNSTESGNSEVDSFGSPKIKGFIRTAENGRELGRFGNNNDSLENEYLKISYSMPNPNYGNFAIHFEVKQKLRLQVYVIKGKSKLKHINFNYYGANNEVEEIKKNSISILMDKDSLEIGSFVQNYYFDEINKYPDAIYRIYFIVDNSVLWTNMALIRNQNNLNAICNEYLY